MKKILQRIFIYILIVTVFISGNGVVVAIHTCFSSDSKNVSFFKDDSCCPDEECDGENSKDCLSSNCCSSEVSYHKIETTFLPQKTFEFSDVLLICSQLFSTNYFFSSKRLTFLLYLPIQRLLIPILYNQLLI